VRGFREPVLLHPIEQCASGHAKKLRGAGAIAMGHLESEHDERSFDGVEVYTGVRHDHYRRISAVGVGPAYRDRWILIGDCWPRVHALLVGQAMCQRKAVMFAGSRPENRSICGSFDSRCLKTDSAATGGDG
jgi:hypothetical protein